MKEKMDQFERTRRVIGSEGVSDLQKSRVLIFGVGGVGSYVAEGLARAGIGHITLVDADVVDVTNINRQIPALHSTIGRPKVEVMAERIRDINPECRVQEEQLFFMPEDETIDFSSYDYVVDAVDTVTAKIEIILRAKQAGVPVISSMGTGNKVNPGMFRITALEKTKVCPLAKVMRKEMRKRGITDVKVFCWRQRKLCSVSCGAYDCRRSCKGHSQLI